MARRYKFKVVPDFPQHSDIRHMAKMAEDYVKREMDYVVCVVDMDRLLSRPKEMAAFQKMKKRSPRNVIWIETNPCTEFWFLLHFLPQLSTKHYETYEDLLPDLQRYMPGYEKTARYFRKNNLYEYLTAKHENGTFVLRIEDTDQERYVEGATQVIYDTMKLAGLSHDEGPDVGGEYGPYVQSERLGLYKPYAEQLVKEGKAYRCFCTKERLDELRASAPEGEVIGYDRHCRDLSQEEIEAKLAAGTPYVIRQKMPLDGVTTYNDLVYGEISFPNEDLDDQILLKTDGYPTYNFANVIDDHTMGITHVVRGSEYLSSTPKYNLLYEAFGWEIPTYIHLPLIMGKTVDENGKEVVSKLSKRH